MYVGRLDALAVLGVSAACAAALAAYLRVRLAPTSARRQLVESSALRLAELATATACACFATQVVLLGFRDSWETWFSSFFVWFCALPIAAILAVVSCVSAGNRRPLLIFGLASLLCVIAVWLATMANIPSR